MKNYLKILFLFIISNSLSANAQSTKVYDFFYEKFGCKNSNGVIEYLKISNDNQKILYSTSHNPQQDITLKILNPNSTFLEYFGEGTKVQFPNDSKIYILKAYPSDENFIECINPDKTLQKFYMFFELAGPKGTFRCINPDNTIEYLYISYTNSKNLNVKYTSSNKHQWINLKTSNIKIENSVFLNFEDILQFDVQFPNSPEKYTIIYPKLNEPVKFPEIFVKNPDGSTQKFQWINKE